MKLQMIKSAVCHGSTILSAGFSRASKLHPQKLANFIDHLTSALLM